MSLQDLCLRLKAQGTAYWGRRAAAELQFAAALSAANGGRWDALVGQVLGELLRAAETEGAVTRSAVLAAEETLAPLGPAAKALRVRCIGHAHIDMNWMWGLQETAAATVNTFRTMLRLMEEYPEFTFAQSQASTYALTERYAPELLPAIRERIREGRWEVTAASWVENDKNLSGGEAMARHILYTKQYLSRLLEIPASSLVLDFEPDTFGHAATLPEILAAGGVKYYYHCRGSQSVPPVTRWTVPSGRSVLCYREPNWYNAALTEDMFAEVPQFCHTYGVDVMLKVFGVGDHGGGPTRRDLNLLADVMTWPIQPTVTFGTYRSFFEELETYGDRIPTVTGERNFVFTGCYTTQSRIKMANRIGEERLYEAECLSAQARLLGGADDTAQFAEAWKKILFNQFHDILPGSGTVETREYAMGQFQEAMAAAAVRGEAALRVIAEAVDTSGIPTELPADDTAVGAGSGWRTEEGSGFRLPQSGEGGGKTRIFHLSNPTETDFDGVTELTVWDWNYDKGRARFADAAGAETESQLLTDRAYYWDHWRTVYAVHVRVPAFGYATYTLTEREAELPGFAGIVSARQDTYGDTDIVLENPWVRAVFSGRTAELLSLTERESGRELVRAPAGQLLWITENTREGMTSWRVGPRMRVEPLQQTREVHITEMHTGGLRQWLRFELRAGEQSHVEVTVTLDAYSRMPEWAITADFRDCGTPEHVPQLTFALPQAARAKTYRYDIPCGMTDRPALPHDVPAHSLAAAVPEEGGAALCVVTDCKYGFRGDGETLSVTLLRAAYDPDPMPEYGIHRVRIGVGALPDARPQTLLAAADGFLHPPAAAAGTTHPGSLPLCGQWLRTEGCARVSAVKTAEDGKGWVIRVYDAAGEGGSYTLIPARPVQRAVLTDLSEQPLPDGEQTLSLLDGNRVCGSLPRGGLATVYLRLS